MNGYVINTNVASLNSHAVGIQNGRVLETALERLSSGLRINKAADDASGMAIADSLRSQASSLGQAIRNANDATGMIQIADKAMDEQIKILDSVKTKAVQVNGSVVKQSCTDCILCFSLGISLSSNSSVLLTNTGEHQFSYVCTLPNRLAIRKA